MVLNTSLDSLDVTKAGERGRDLSMLYQVEDENVAGAAHRMLIKTGHSHLYSPGDGFTTPVPRFQDDIAALIQLTDFWAPPTDCGQAISSGASVLWIWRRIRQTIWHHHITELQLQGSASQSHHIQHRGAILDWALDSGGGGRELKLQGAQKLG